MIVLSSWLGCTPDAGRPHPVDPTTDPEPPPPDPVPEVPCDRVDQNGDGIAEGPLGCTYRPGDADLVLTGIVWVVPDLDATGGSDLWVAEGRTIEVFDTVSLGEICSIVDLRPRGDAAQFWYPTVGDFDGDGLADIGVGDGIYGSPRGVVTPGDTVARIVPPVAREWSYPFGADVDGDGVYDLVVSTGDYHTGGRAWAPGPFSGDVVLDPAELLSLPVGPSPPPPPATPDGCEWLQAIGDYTGDGTTDWACGRRAGGTAVFDGTDLAEPYATWSDLYFDGAADVDGDGRVDLVGKIDYGPNGIYAGGRRGRVTAGEERVLVSLWGGVITAIGELDGAPGLDLLLYDGSSARLIRGLGF